MDNDVVFVTEQRFSRSMSKPVSGAGDEDTSLLVGVQRRRRRNLFLPRMRRGLRDGRCGCHKGPRDYTKANLYFGDKKSSTVHGRAVLSSGFWLVCSVITHEACVPLLVRLSVLHAGSLMHSVFRGQSFTKAPTSTLLPDEVANHTTVIPPSTVRAWPTT